MKVGSYRLVRPCGEGGQGRVWEARGPGSERVALKEFDKPDARTLERIGRELQLCADARHDHLVSVFDLVEARDHFWVAMNFVEGEHLGARVADSGTLQDQREFALVMIQVASALARLHGGNPAKPNYRDGGYAHRDVKPRNIVVDGHGTGVHATLVDLSLITALDGITTNPLMAVRYAAPEQLRGEKPSDRVDVYSLAATGFFLLAGHPPHDVDLPPSEALQARLAMIEAGDPPPLSEHARQEWAGDYDELFAEALARAPEDRPSALQMAKRILAITWPVGAPHGVARIPAELEPAALEANALSPPDMADPWRPREKLLATTGRTARGGADLARQASLVERAEGIEAARPIYAEAARLGEARACAWVAQDRENELGTEAAVDLWRVADEGGSAVAARRLGQIELAAGDSEAAVAAFRRAAERRDPPGAFELATLLGESPSLAANAEEAERVFLLAVELNHPEACRRAGERAHQEGRIIEAERLYARADRGGDPVAPRWLGMIHDHRGDLDLAQVAFERAIDRGHDSAYIPYAYLLGQNGATEMQGVVLRAARDAGVARAAQALARWLVPHDPDAAYRLVASEEARRGDPKAQFTFAAAAFQLKRLDEAIETLESLPGPGGHRLMLSAAYLAKGRVEEAGEAADSAGSSSTPPWILALAEPALERFAERPAVGDLAPAALQRAELARFRAGDPQPGDPTAEAVRKLFEDGRELGCAKCAAWAAHYTLGTEAEIAELERAAEMGDIWAIARLAQALYNAGEKEAAAEAYRAAIAAGAAETVTHFGPRYMLGSGNVTGSQLEEMLWQAERAGSPHAAYSLAHLISAGRGWRDPEIEHLLSRADLRGSPEAADLLGLLQGSIRGDLDAAEAAHRRAFRRRRTGEYAYNVAVVANERGNAAEADRFWEIAAELGDVSSRAVLAGRWFERGEEERAIEYATAAIEHATDVVDFYCLGVFFSQAGEHTQAVECFRPAHDRGYAWASLSYSSYLEDPEAVRVLSEALAHIDDDTHRYWYLYSRRDDLRRRIAERLDGLPKIGKSR